MGKKRALFSRKETTAKKPDGLKKSQKSTKESKKSAKKSKKSGKMDNFVLEPTEAANERPELEFETGRYSIPEILDSHLLPLVVQHDSGGQPGPFNKFHFDLTQPLLLYKKRNIQKVAATSLHIQGERYEDLGESLLIPEDYKGWFAVLQRLTGYTKADDSVPHFASVEELASSSTEKFLIGGTKKISGLQILDRSEGQIKHEQRYFFPGDTLTAEKIEFGEAKKRTRLFRKPKYIREKFLMCTDETDRDILLPFEQQGIFYQISHRSGKPQKHVMQMSDIVARKLTPRIIKLVFGRFPVTPCAFTGLMKAESSRIETSVIAATIVNKQNILMEIPTNNEIFFKIAVTNDNLRQNPCYRNAMHFCAERASTYMRNIKICYNFTPRAGAGVPNDFVLKTPPPESCAPHEYVLFDGPIKKTTTDEDRSDSGNYTIDSFRHSDISDVSEVSIRPGRCASAGRMSFCLGNSYLTVPVFDTVPEKRNSGNNNTSPEMPLTTKGSRISFNGKFMEMEGGALPEEDETSGTSSMEEIPPPMACTNATMYVNRVDPPKAEANPEFPDYIPTTSSRRPSSLPPDTAPPPIPLSSSTSGVSSGSISSVSDGVSSKRASSESFEYDVPKADSSGSSSSSVSRATITSDNGMRMREDAPVSPDTGASSLVRRPSTYTFAEGCSPGGGRGRGKVHVELVEELEESRVDVDSPIYENIQSLVEICKKLDLECGHMEKSDSNSELARPTSDLSITDPAQRQEDQAEPINEDVSICIQDEYCEKAERRAESHRETYEETVSKDQSNHLNTAMEAMDIPSTLDSGGLTPTHSCSTLSASPKSVNSESLHVEEKGVESETREVKHDTRTGNYCEIESIDNESCVEATFKQSLRDVADTDNENVKSDMMFDFDAGELGSILSRQLEAGVSQSYSAKVGVHKEQQSERSFEISTESINVTSTEIKEATLCETRYTVDTLATHENTANECEKLLFKSVSEESESSMSDDTAELLENRQIVLRKVKKTKSGNSASSEGSREFPSDPDELCRLSSSEVREHFRSIGIRDATLGQIEELDINGVVLNDVLNGEKTLRDSMGGVNLIDQQKISMFIRGWRPQTE